MYQKFIFITLFSFLILQFLGCNEKDNIVNPNEDVITYLNGKIESWPQVTSKVLKLGKPSNQAFLEFGNSLIDANGNFNLNTTIPAESLNSPIIDWFNIDSTMNLQIVNYGTKGIDSYLNIFSDSVTEPIGEVMFSSDTLNAGEGYFRVSYFYSEGDFQIIGSITTEHNSDNFNGTQETYYNIHFKQGWNKLVGKVLEEIKSENIITYLKGEWSSEVPGNGKWFHRFY